MCVCMYVYNINILVLHLPYTIYNIKMTGINVRITHVTMGNIYIFKLRYLPKYMNFLWYTNYTRNTQTLCKEMLIICQ